MIAGGNVDEGTRDRARAALHAAVADPALAPVRQALRIDGLQVLPPTAYDRIRALAAAGGVGPDG